MDVLADVVVRGGDWLGILVVVVLVLAAIWLLRHL